VVQNGPTAISAARTKTQLKGVGATNLVRRHRVGLAALQTYSISRQLIRQKEHVGLLPHVQGMKGPQ